MRFWKVTYFLAIAVINFQLCWIDFGIGEVFAYEGQIVCRFDKWPLINQLVTDRTSEIRTQLIQFHISFVWMPSFELELTNGGWLFFHLRYWDLTDTDRAIGRELNIYLSWLDFRMEMRRCRIFCT